MSRFLVLLVFFLGSLFAWAKEPIPNDSVHIDELVEQAFELETKSELDSALRLARVALDLAEDFQYESGIADACMRIGSCLNKQGENEKALNFARRAFDVRKRSKDYLGATSACFTLTYIYSYTGNIDSAFAILYEALRLNSFTKDSLDLAAIYIELANLNTDYGDLEEAIGYLQKSESILSIVHDPLSLCLTYKGMGKYFYMKENFTEAIEYFLKAEGAIDGLDYRLGIAKISNDIAICYDQLKQYEKATYYFHQALDEYTFLNLKNDEALVCFNLASMYNGRNLPDSAVYYLNRSVDLTRETQDKVRLAASYEYLSDAYVLKGDYKRAYEYQLRSSNLNDTVLNDEKISSIAEMQTKYETEKKESQIKFLDEKNRAQTRQRNRLIAGMLILLGLALLIFIQRNKVIKERERSEELLLNILPEKVAEELKSKGEADAQLIDNVTVLFTDFKGFTVMSEVLTAKELVSDLNDCFSEFDRIVGKFGIEKIKTIGDAYMAAGGLPIPNDTHAQDVVKAAFEMRDFVEAGKAKKIEAGLPYFEIRIGIHTGPVVAGIVGVKKFQYDIWGDTVNTASRMESSGEVGKVNISEATYELLKDNPKFVFTNRGKVEAKGKGEMKMWFVSHTS